MPIWCCLCTQPYIHGSCEGGSTPASLRHYSGKPQSNETGTVPRARKPQRIINACWTAYANFLVRMVKHRDLTAGAGNPRNPAEVLNFGKVPGNWIECQKECRMACVLLCSQSVPFLSSCLCSWIIGRWCSAELHSINLLPPCAFFRHDFRCSREVQT